MESSIISHTNKKYGTKQASSKPFKQIILITEFKHIITVYPSLLFMFQQLL